jgi:hypothetical protein
MAQEPLAHIGSNEFKDDRGTDWQKKEIINNALNFL